jgi:hypothetical protein
MTDRELMQQALSVLCNNVYPRDGVRDNRHLTPKSHAAIYQQTVDALRERLAQPEQEPVAYRYKMPVEDDHWVYNFCQFPDDKSNPMLEPLYTTPPQRKPLTLEQQDEIVRQASENDWHDYEVIMAVEAAHGIKP